VSESASKTNESGNWAQAPHVTDVNSHSHSHSHSFHLPPELNADRPPERRGLVRDRVRLLVLNRRTGATEHSRFDHLGDFLRPKDLLVFNSSRTLPAALIASGPQFDVEVRLAERLPDGSWMALLTGTQKENRIMPELLLDFGLDLTATVLSQDARIPALSRLRFSKSGTDFLDRVYRLGEPIRYRYLSSPWGLSYYQNVYGHRPGGSEMPSAGRAFSWRLLFELRRKGVDTASVTLHAGLSSYLDDALDRQHIASEEEYWINEATAKKIRRARKNGGRLIAIGTTVVRALESMAQQGEIRAQHAYTRLRITTGYRLQLIDGLLTGLHEPEASHLDLLAAFVPPATIQRAYAEAIEQRYLWHEFGDVNLIV
jgi:S-adenosylmethionine:tRNA ribosyltransferase-isomerase